MDLSVRQLRAFVAIARLNSFTKAAEVLHTTQPALSAQINQMEAALGVRLFTRSTRLVTLTQVGRELLPMVDKIAQDLGAVASHAKGISQKTAGRVAIAALPSIASSFLPQVIADFSKQFPGIQVTLSDGLADSIAQLVYLDRVDFGVGSSAPNDRQLEFTLLGSDELVAVLPANHALATSKRLKLKQLLDQPLILMNRGTSVRRVVDEACAAQGQLPLAAYEATYMSTAIGMVRAGLGLTLLPSSALELSVATDLVCRPLNDPLLKRSIGIVRKRGRSLSPAAEAFLALLGKKATLWFDRKSSLVRRRGRP